MIPHMVDHPLHIKKHYENINFINEHIQHLFLYKNSLTNIDIPLIYTR